MRPARAVADLAVVEAEDLVRLGRLPRRLLLLLKQARVQIRVEFLQRDCTVVAAVDDAVVLLSGFFKRIEEL